jgi:glycolate oxidase FAD binding subunit
VASVAPESIEEAAEVLREADAVRFTGGGTKAGWGEPVEVPPLEVSTQNLSEVVEHNADDLTAVVGAGVRFSDAQERFRRAGQMLAIDPPAPEGATIGGIVATGDSGPLRHRYGAIRDLVLGTTLVLADGTIARSGGKVIKNVAGYDLAKLFCGSFGTLGLVAQLAVRLHPLAPRTLSLVVRSNDPLKLKDAALNLSHLPLEFDSLDINYDRGRGEVLARFGGADPAGRLEAARRAVTELRLEAETVDDDDAIWDRQRRAQRSNRGAVVKVSAVPDAADRVVKAVDDSGGSVVGRAGIGLYWITIEGEDSELVAAIDQIRNSLPEFHSVVLDAPPEVRRKVDVWGPADDGAVAIMRRVKQRFDPTSKCNPGSFVGGI